MSVTFNVDTEGPEKLAETIKLYQKDAETKINMYLHGKGYDRFDKAIHNAMPVSGRRWKGKKSPAKNANSLQDKLKNENLAVTIRATTAYGYLYFPNDGSNTRRHYGGQYFFDKAVEQETTQAINDMLELLMKEV